LKVIVTSVIKQNIIIIVSWKDVEMKFFWQIFNTYLNIIVG
jgi:hypothetical protein